MRTTVDIDDDVLAVAKDLAKAEGRSMGAVISDLVRQALTQPRFPIAGGLALSPGMEETQMAYITDDFPTFPTNRTGLPVTGELVRRLQDQIDLEDASVVNHETGDPRTGDPKTGDHEHGVVSGSKSARKTGAAKR
jgi:hypothetical protein